MLCAARLYEGAGKDNQQNRQERPPARKKARTLPESDNNIPENSRPLILIPNDADTIAAGDICKKEKKRPAARLSGLADGSDKIYVHGSGRGCRNNTGGR